MELQLVSDFPFFGNIRHVTLFTAVLECSKNATLPCDGIEFVNPFDTTSV